MPECKCYFPIVDIIHVIKHLTDIPSRHWWIQQSVSSTQNTRINNYVALLITCMPAAIYLVIIIRLKSIKARIKYHLPQVSQFEVLCFVFSLQWKWQTVKGLELLLVYQRQFWMPSHRKVDCSHQYTPILQLCSPENIITFTIKLSIKIETGIHTYLKYFILLHNTPISLTRMMKINCLSSMPNVEINYWSSL